MDEKEILLTHWIENLSREELEKCVSYLAMEAIETGDYNIMDPQEGVYSTITGENILE